MKRKWVKLPKHPLATKNGCVRLARANLWDKLKGQSASCYWCNLPLVWMIGEKQRKVANALCVDHIDRDSLNDKPNNLVASCRECNANRHTGGRVKPKECKSCHKPFIPRKRKAMYCSNKCSAKAKYGIKRGSNAEHGTIGRYRYGCRCKLCKKENTKVSTAYYKKTNYNEKRRLVDK